MQFKYTQITSLPPLAWLALIRKSSKTIEVIHGPGVITSDDFFFEGAWAGALQSADFDTNYSFGSGCKAQDLYALFVPPTHTLECLFYSLTEDDITISNSLAFLLNTIDDNLSNDDLTYMEALNEVSRGLDKGVVFMQTLACQRIGILYYDHIEVDAELNLTFKRPSFVEEFNDYESYTGYVQDVLGCVFQNSADKSRRHSYYPLATMSSGYDSPTIAAWAKSKGCREAVTFPNSRGSSDTDSDDSGSEIAKCLNYDIITVPRLAYTQSEGTPEIDTWGVGTELLSLRTELLKTPRLLLVGFMGDSVWERELLTVSTDLKWKLRAGQSSGELRLATDFVYVPVPFIGAQKIPEINKISRSEEMRPWTLFSDYDRPICRRTLEEAGVPRHLVARQKRVAGVYFRVEGLRNTMTPQSYESFQKFRKLYEPKMLGARLVFPHLIWVLRNLNERARKKLYAKVFHSMGIRLLMPLVIPESKQVTKESFLFHWAVHLLQERYRSATEFTKKMRAVSANTTLYSPSHPRE